MGWRRQGCVSLAGSEAEGQAVVGLSGEGCKGERGSEAEGRTSLR